MGFWETLWTYLWFVGLAIFSVLAVVVTIGGAGDLVSLLRNLSKEDDPDAPVAHDASPAEGDTSPG
jgi:hypothetical protein